MSVTSRFPAAWRCTVTVHRSGGADRRGNPLEPVDHTVPDCLITTQSSEDPPGQRSDRPDTTAYIYGPAGGDFLSTDQVTVPESSPVPRLWPSGRFQVNGEPDFGPLGVRVELRRSS